MLVFLFFQKYVTFYLYGIEVQIIRSVWNKKTVS